MVHVRLLRWDPGVVAHIARHGVRPEEVDELRRNDPLESSAYAGRVMLIGPTTVGRMLAAIIAHQGDGVYIVITARPASRKERRRYYERLNGEQ